MVDVEEAYRKRVNNRLSDLIANNDEIVRKAICKKYGTKGFGRITGGDFIYGETVDDMISESIVKFLSWIRENPHKKSLPELTDSYYVGSIMSNFGKELHLRKRKLDLVSNPEHCAKIKKHIYNDCFARDEISGVEIKELKKTLGGKFKALLRMIEEGYTIHEIQKRMNISSIRQYYNVIERLRCAMIERGYCEER